MWNNQNTATNVVVNLKGSALIPKGGKILVGFPV